MTSTKQIAVPTPDGTCPTVVYHPMGTGPWPAVLVFMDGFGIRPAVLEVGARLAEAGYFVVVPDMFYRAGDYAPVDAPATLRAPDAFNAFRARFATAMTPDGTRRDVGALLEWIAKEPLARPGPVATTGYCMGGGVALSAAGWYPERVAAAASFHGGNLATDRLDSPHLLAPSMRAQVHVAGAIEDGSFPDEMKERLRTALEAAGVKHTIETVAARHGWVLRDMPTHDTAATASRDDTLRALLRRTL